jgi:acyl-CoA reductase-like NAD-dependent aldehyde dehydrogenase
MSLLEIVNPATGETIEKIPADSAGSVAAKYGEAREGVAAWAAVPLREKLAALQAFRERLETGREELARILTRETGKPISQARNELKSFLLRIDFFAAHVARVLEPETVWDDPAGGMLERITHEPLGVVANISAWNYPYFVGGNVFIPALLTGNAVLYKPSEYSTLTGLAVARLLHESGFMRKAFIPVIGGGEAGGILAGQPVDGIFFTGSYATGLKIARAAADGLKKAQLELGGKDPAYVCEDAEIGFAAASLADGAFYNTGQSCCAVERIYVHEAVQARFLETFVGEVRRFKVGDPMDESTYIGPLARRPQLEVLDAQVRDSVAKGARLILGGSRIDGPGNYFEPTVLAEVDHTMSVMRAESFGPIIGIMAVADDAEAVRLMNDSEYGLTAGVYTPDRTRAERILRQVASGSAYWNCCDRVSPRLPWSGVRHSGLGLTLSTHGIQAFTRARAWHLRHILPT